VAAGSNSYSWDLVCNSDVRQLLSLVQKRLPRIKRARYDEKLDEQVSPFQSLEQLDGIEDWLWREGEKGKRAGFVSLRTRFALLMCYGGVLRSESLFLGELSDCFLFEAKKKDDADAMEVMVMQIATGKTVDSEHKQFGRAMRHLDPSRCAISAFLMMLLYRFWISGEMSDGTRPDFTDNKAWFNIKILSDGSLLNTKEMQRRSYTEKVKECFKKLGIMSGAYGHWGRIAAPPLMELEEVSPEFIRCLGKSPCVLVVVRVATIVD
jgi:hypothetical protein